MTISRRAVLAFLSTIPLARWPLASAQEGAPAMGLGFSLYGMKSLPIEQALRTCREIGYDCVELPVMTGWPGDSQSLSEERVASIRAALDQTGLRLSALMENLSLHGEDVVHEQNLQRLRAAAKLGRALAPEQTPVIETVLGGRPQRWEQDRQAMAERLRDWAATLREAGAILAIKAHVGGALHRPEDAVWLMREADSEAVRLAFDYSHFQLRDIPLRDAVETMIPWTVFVHVKDRRGTAERFEFLLPGEGDTDYPLLFRELARTGYRGDVLVEVSGQIHSRPDYDPLAAAKICYASLSQAMEKAGVKRR